MRSAQVGVTLHTRKSTTTSSKIESNYIKKVKTTHNGVFLHFASLECYSNGQ